MTNASEHVERDVAALTHYIKATAEATEAVGDALRNLYQQKESGERRAFVRWLVVMAALLAIAVSPVSGQNATTGTVTPDAALEETLGLRVTYQGGTDPFYLVGTLAQPVDNLSIAFKIRAEEISLPHGFAHHVLRLESDSRLLAYVALSEHPIRGPQLLIRGVQFDGSRAKCRPIQAGSGDHSVRLDWSSTGELSVWFDGEQRCDETYSGSAADLAMTIKFGAVAGVDAPTLGVLDLDAVQVDPLE